MADSRFDYCVGTANNTLRRTVVGMLADDGFYLSGEGKNSPELLRVIRLTQPWLAVIDTQLPPGNIRQLASIIEEDSLSAVLFINTGSAIVNGFMFLQWPVEGTVLTAVAKTLCLEYSQKKKLHNKIKGLECKLSSRIEVEKAKGILMRKLSLDEDSAYRYMQKFSMEKKISMNETACRIIANQKQLFPVQPHR